MTLTIRKMVLRTAAVAAVAGVVASAVGAPANADPKQLNAFVGVGSDTTQDFMNAASGFSTGFNYTPVQSSVASGQKQVISFDATGSTCITVKTGAGSFDRPNGSSAGRRALSRSIDGAVFGVATNGCGGPKSISNLVDFARSSAGPLAGDTGTTLTYIPFGRDGMSFAYYRTDGSPVTSLTRAQLTTLFSTGRQTIGGVSILPCGIQTSSGTYQFWNSAAGISVAQEAAAVAECAALPTGLANGRSQENDGVELKAMGDAADAAVNGTQVVIGFGAGPFVAKSNGVATPTPPANVGMGAISDDGAGNNLGFPVTGTAPNVAPVASFFANTVFGRNVYNVLPTAKIDSALGNTDLKTLFKGATSAICLDATVRLQYGFVPAANCGDSSLKGSLFTGSAP